MLILIPAAFASAVKAGTISIQATTTCNWVNDELMVTVSVRNLGDEPAEDATVHLAFRDSSISSDESASLKPGEDHSFQFTFKPAVTFPGTYPIRIKTVFRDNKGRAHSGLSYGVFHYKQVAKSELEVLTTSGGERSDEIILVSLVNKSSQHQKGVVSVFHPDNVKFDIDASEFSLGPEMRRSIEFKVKNLAGEPGSTFPVLFIAEFERDGLHCLNVAEAGIEVKEKPVFWVRNGAWLLSAGLLLLFAVIAVEYVVLKRR